MYNGGFEDFSVTGSFHMERAVSYKNDPMIESDKRLNMAYLLLKNPKMIDVIQKEKACFFHGTNVNALPSILKYGLNSVNKLLENDIPVTTGEKWSRIEGKRSFISLTDCIDVAHRYAVISQNKVESANTLLNFGVMIGVSLEHMNDVVVSSVKSDLSEIGVVGTLPVEHIKFLAVPDDKIDFVKKMIGEKKIDVVSMEMKRDVFFNGYIDEKLNFLEQVEQNQEIAEQPSLIYSKDNIKPVVSGRKISKIKEMFQRLKARLYKGKEQDLSERN